MLHRDELVALLSCFYKRHMEANFEFLGNHDSPFTNARFAFKFDWISASLPLRSVMNVYDPVLYFFHSAAQWMLVLLGVIADLLHFHQRNIAREHTANAAPLRMNFEHDLRGTFMGMPKKLLQHVNDEFHRRVIVLVHHPLTPRRRLCLVRLRLNGGVVLSRSGGRWLPGCHA